MRELRNKQKRPDYREALQETGNVTLQMAHTQCQQNCVPAVLWLSYIKETQDPKVSAEKSICYKISLQLQWNSRTTGNKRWFFHNVMRTFEMLQHEGNVRGFKARITVRFSKSSLHFSYFKSHRVLIFLCFPPYRVGIWPIDQISSKTISSRKSTTNQNQNWRPPADGLIWEELAGFSFAYISL